MKTLLSLTLSAAFATMVAGSAYAQCAHGYKSADMSELKIASDDVKTQEAMSTFDPANVDLLLDAKKTDEEVKTSE